MKAALCLAFIGVFAGLYISSMSCADPEAGGRGSGPPPPGKSQSNRVPHQFGPDPMDNYKATKPAFNVGPPSAHQRNAI